MRIDILPDCCCFASLRRCFLYIACAACSVDCLRCCELGRSLLSDRQMSLQGGVCSLGGYEPAYRACACVCGKGILRRDLRYISPGEQPCWQLTLYRPACSGASRNCSRGYHPSLPFSRLLSLSLILPVSSLPEKEAIGLLPRRYLVTLPYLMLPYLPSLPLLRGLLNPTRGFRECCKLPSGYGRSPTAKHILVHFEVKIKHFMA